MANAHQVDTGAKTVTTLTPAGRLVARVSFSPHAPGYIPRRVLFRMCEAHLYVVKALYEDNNAGITWDAEETERFAADILGGCSLLERDITLLSKQTGMPIEAQPVPLRIGQPRSSAPEPGDAQDCGMKPCPAPASLNEVPLTSPVPLGASPSPDVQRILSTGHLTTMPRLR